ncbi:heme exporter protein CcmD [Brumicola pallidula]|jgi:heme exporter protein D|uniref:Heme exporter protein D n=1 Tax=Brumicola pallidula DSM 14239 = ACAM 615 TaxID=1121922 RepID=K6ZLU6_9ALTE|nr:heme exporter protein CcmD [Glaciecola pallidula]GAC29843.1 heme exporter protein D [Glaciecola pallidula DSM 14239 = ACAM 615]
MTFQFESISDFFNMGGYAFFVWASFICTFLCMAGVLIQSLVVGKKIKQGVQKEKVRAERIMAARAQRKLKQQAKRNAQDPNNIDNSEVFDEPKT